MAGNGTPPTIGPINAADLIGWRVLVTCDNYFFAPDGKQYRCVFGTLSAVQTSEEALGIKVSARSQDWYVTVGNMRIAGCQIHYVIATEDCYLGKVLDWTSTENGIVEYKRQSLIYSADAVVQE